MMNKKDRQPGRANVPDKRAQENPKGNILFRNGRLRAGWLLLCAVIACRGLSYLIRLGLNAAFASLFSAWRVNAGNIHFAPRWAQAIYSWHGSFITAVVCLAGIALSIALRRLWTGNKQPIRRNFREASMPAALGAGIALISALIFLLADSMRPEWPLSQPHISFGVLLMLPVTLLTALSEEMFSKYVVFDGVSGRSGRLWAYVSSILVFFLFNGGYSGTAASGINVLLMGVVGCMLYEERGLWASVLFRGLWSYVSVFIVGFGAAGAAQSVFRLYSVSEKWLTGGDGGMIYGLWMTAALLAVILMMRRGHIFGLIGHPALKFRAGKKR